MATLSTDQWVESSQAISVIHTDLWSFELTTHNFTLKTDLWLNESILGELPVYNPSLVVTVARVQQNMAFPQFIIGGQGGVDQDEYQLFKKSSSYGFNVWRSPVYKIGSDFNILQITIPLIADIAAGMSIIPKLYFDDEARTTLAPTINLNNYDSDQKLIILTAQSFNNEVFGKYNFFLELQFWGAVLSPVSLPIYIDLDIHEKQ